MQKLLLISVIIAPIALPILASRERSANKAFKRTLFYFFAFNVFYVFALRFLFSRLF